MLPQKNKNRLRRLKSKGVIDRLFLEGEGLHSKNLFLRIIQDKDSPFLYAGVSVSKRNFKKAVDRNRIKRQLRVALKTESVFAFCPRSPAYRQVARLQRYPHRPEYRHARC